MSATRRAAAWVASIVCVISFAAPCRGARAAPVRPLVQVGIEPCVEVNAAEVIRLVAIELPTAQPDRQEPDDAATRVAVSCRADAIHVHVTDPLTRKALERPVRLHQAVRPARARLLALAIVELVVASWTELELGPQRPTTSAPAVPVSAPQAEAKRAARAVVAAKLALARPLRFRLVAGGGADWFQSPLGLAAGAGLRLAADHATPALGWSIDLRLHRAAAATSLGAVSLESASVMPAVLVHRSHGAMTLRGGVGAKAGIGRMLGSPYDPTDVEGLSFVAPWFGPAGVASLGIQVLPWLVAELTLEAGWVVLPMAGRVDGRRELVVGGPWLGSQLGVGWSQ